MPGDEPGFVVASSKLDERGSQLFDGVEGSHPQHVGIQARAPQLTLIVDPDASDAFVRPKHLLTFVVVQVRGAGRTGSYRGIRDITRKANYWP